MYRLKKEKIKFPEEASRCFPIFKWKTCHFCGNEFSFELGWKIHLKHRYYDGTDYEYLCSRCVNGDKQMALDIINDRLAEHDYNLKNAATKKFIKPPVKKYNPSDFNKPVEGTIEKKNFFNKATNEALKITAKDKEIDPDPDPDPMYDYDYLSKLKSKFDIMEELRRKEAVHKDAKKIKDAISLLQGHMGINHRDYMDKVNQNVALASKLAMIETIKSIRGG